MGRARLVLMLTGRAINEGLSFLVFILLDLLDLVLCLLFKVADFVIEADWRQCSSKDAAPMPITTYAKILLSEKGQPTKIVRLTSSTSTKLLLEDISDTLYSRPSLVSEISKTTVGELKRLKLEATLGQHPPLKKSVGVGTAAFTVNSTIVEMLQGKIGRHQTLPVPRWSDCDCTTCTSWTSSSSSSSSSSSKDTLFVHVTGAKGENKAMENVLFIHGFISSSKFWTETLFPNFSASVKSKYRLFAVDLLGFGRSPKPTDSLYTLREHVEMIERSVLDKHKLKSFHIVAHSLGCILALALSVRHPSKIKSITLIAPPYFPVPKGEQGTQYILRKVAPRRVWPPIAFGASIACWYEHISRTVCLLICKNHQFLEFLTKLVTRNRIRTFLIEGFMCHTHHSAWHTLHNIICGAAIKLDKYMEFVNVKLKCKVTIYHGRDDEVLPVECSYDVQSKIPRARVEVVDNTDHITIVVGRQKAFAQDLEAIWNMASSSTA